MNPELLSLSEEYLPEKLDYLHRTLNKSSWLFSQWKVYLDQNKESETFDFTNWTRQFHPTSHRFEKVLYLRELELVRYRLQFRSSYCFMNDNPLTNEMDMKRLRKEMAFVIRPDENIYAITLNAGKDITSNATHHSSLSSGEPVFSAGEISALNGSILSMTDRSGHYKPDLYSFIYGLGIFIRQGANLSQTAVTINSWSMRDSRQYSSATKLHAIYSARGFMHPNYMGKVNSIEDALEALKICTNVEQRQAVFLISDANNLFQFSKGLEKNNWTYIKFDELYAMELCETVSTPAYSSSIAKKLRMS